ncbi:MAG: hypothetical protein QXN96_02520 [Candidatus Bathyarchaeia archaeon]
MEWFNRYKKYLVISVLILFLIISGLAIYFWRQAALLKQNPQRIVQKEIEDTLARVGRLILLPEGETPTLATVTDTEKLKGQAFFVNAKAGDKVIIYTNAKKAILYRPSENKIIEVAPLNIGTETEK